MPLASTLLVLLNRGAVLQITSIVEGQAGHLHQAGLTRSPTSEAWCRSSPTGWRSWQDGGRTGIDQESGCGRGASSAAGEVARYCVHDFSQGNLL
jgi:hypothetical protein